MVNILLSLNLFKTPPEGFINGNIYISINVFWSICHKENNQNFLFHLLKIITCAFFSLKHIEDTCLFCHLHTCKGGLKPFAKTICSLEIYLIVQLTVWKNLWAIKRLTDVKT